MWCAGFLYFCHLLTLAISAHAFLQQLRRHAARIATTPAKASLNMILFTVPGFTLDLV